MCTPQEDIDCYCNAEWKKTHYETNNFIEAQNIIDDELIDFIETTDDQDIRKFHRSYIRRHDHVCSLKPLIDKIMAIDSIESMAQCIKKLDYMGISSIFNTSVGSHHRKPLVYVLDITEPDLTLPTTQNYGEPMWIEKLNGVASKIRKYIIGNLDVSITKTFDHDVLMMETVMAKKLLTVAETQNNNVIFNSMDKKAFVSKFDSNGFFVTYLSGLCDDCIINVQNVEYLKLLRNMFQKNTPTIIRMMRHYVLFSLMIFVSYFIDDLHDLMKISMDYTPQKTFVRLFKRTFPYHLQLFYENKHPLIQQRKNIAVMFNEIRQTYINHIDQSNQLCNESKQNMIAKLRSLKILVGPQQVNQPLNFPKLGDSFFINMFKIHRFFAKDSVSSLGKPINNNLVSVSHDSFTFIATAFCVSMPGIICIPTGIIQKPFYDSEKDMCYNYGSLGSIIGHEIMHCFDNVSTAFDSNGLLIKMMTDCDGRMYSNEIQKIINHYESLDINGSDTRTENVSDIMGIKMALRTYIRVCPNADIRRFFYQWAIVFRMSTEQEKEKRDPHAPNSIRINAPLSHIPEYYDVFELNPSHKNYLNPGQRFSFLDD